MFARVTTFEGPADQLDEGTRYTRESVLPTARRDAGWKGVISLIDRGTGKALTITLWETEDTMRATEEDANTLRGDIASSSGATIKNVERYEVAMFEVESM
jgi:hypothetical protein